MMSQGGDSMDSDSQFGEFGEEDLGIDIGEYSGGRNSRGEREGHGETTLPGGDRYVGQYKNGLRHGQGRYRWKSTGAYYEGQYKKGRRHGRGTLIYPDGSKYTGQFLEGVRSGSGHYMYRNGDTYNGEWQHNMKHGHGIYHYSEAGVTYVGTYKYDSRHGPAEIYFKTCKFVGQFFKDQPRGPCKYIYNDGTCHHGQYVPELLLPSSGAEDDEPAVGPIKWHATRVTQVPEAEWAQAMKEAVRLAAALKPSMTTVAGRRQEAGDVAPGDVAGDDVSSVKITVTRPSGSQPQSDNLSAHLVPPAIDVVPGSEESSVQLGAHLASASLDTSDY